ncbi:MAG: bifunctional UDP-N-acetylglucosamine diphosphorylase/glucosamine-1-phosphate N-acetyltransferase GlmU, partial [Candidatus Binatia bacterium]
MKSALPKVLHPLAGRPLFIHALGTAQRLLPARVAIVIGHGADLVRQAHSATAVAWAIQDKQLGTGHAVLCAKEVFDGFSGEVLILSGDVPLIKEATLRAMVDKHRSRQAAVTLLTAVLDRPQGYGRVVRDASGRVTGIVEEKDASEGQRQIGEVNAGVYVASSAFLFAALGAVKNDNRQGEYYLPDIVTIGLAQGKTIETVQAADAREMMGVNTKEDLAFMEKSLRESINRQWMLAGVTLKDPDTTYIDEGVTIGKDTVIGPNTQLRGKTIIGERCQIDGTAFLTDVEIADDVQLKFSVMLTACRVGGGAIVGPFAQL